MRRVFAVLFLTSVAAFAGSYAIELEGSGQHGPVGATLESPVCVTVTDSLTGEPVEGVSVVMRIRPGNGALLPLEGTDYIPLEQEESGVVHRLVVYTDEHGTARSGLRLSESMGGYGY